MASYIAAAATGQRPANTYSGGQVAALNYGEYTVATALAATDTIRLCKLPAEHIVVDFIGTTGDLDTNGTPTIVFDVGIEDTVGATDDDDAIVAATAVGQAGGVFRLDEAAAAAIAPVNYDRFVTITVDTGAATGATSILITGALLSRPQGRDD